MDNYKSKNAWAMWCTQTFSIQRHSTFKSKWADCWQYLLYYVPVCMICVILVIFMRQSEYLYWMQFELDYKDWFALATGNVSSKFDFLLYKKKYFLNDREEEIFFSVVSTWYYCNSIMHRHCWSYGGANSTTFVIYCWKNREFKVDNINSRLRI